LAGQQSKGTKSESERVPQSPTELLKAEEISSSEILKDQDQEIDERAIREKWILPSDVDKASEDRGKGEEERKDIKPWQSTTWESSWGAKFRFTMPPASVYRRAVSNRRVTIGADGTVSIDPSAIEPLIDDFVRPKPNEEEMSPRQWEELCLNYWFFLRGGR